MKSAVVASATDPSGLSGLAQDVRVMHGAGVHAAVVVTAVTAQGRGGILAVKPSTPETITRQWVCAMPVASRPRVAKVGLVPTLAAARRLGVCIATHDALAVIDTPFSASWGGNLTLSDPVRIYRSLMPHAALATPNLDEAGRLAGLRVRDEDGMVEAADAIMGLGAGAVLVKGGHLEGEPVDMLATPDGVKRFRHARSAGKPRGTGCALSSLIAARIAQGLSVGKAVESAEREFPKGLAGIPVGGVLAYDASALRPRPGR